MFKVVRNEHYDIIDNVAYFYHIIKGVPRSIAEKCREIDGKNYDKDCFGVCVILDVDGWDIMIDTKTNGNIYYVDADGNKHWFATNRSGTEARTFYNFTIGFLKNKSTDEGGC